MPRAVAVVLALALVPAVDPAAADAGTSDRPISKRVPLTGPLAEDEPDAGTHVPLFRPNCRWRTERYYQPDKGWRSRRILECR